MPRSSRLTLYTEPLIVHSRTTPHGVTAADPNTTRTYASFTIQAVTSDSTFPSVVSAKDISPEDFLRAHQIVHAHKGALEIESTPDKGVTIKVRIPAAGDTLTSSDSLDNLATQASIVGASPYPADTVNPSASPSERRRFQRHLLSLPVALTMGNSTLRCVLRNMSTRGALLTLRDQSPSVHLQPAYVVIKTPVSFLELQGTAHERPPTTDESTLPSPRTSLYRLRSLVTVTETCCSRF